MFRKVIEGEFVRLLKSQGTHRIVSVQDREGNDFRLFLGKKLYDKISKGEFYRFFHGEFYRGRLGLQAKCDLIEPCLKEPVKTVEGKVKLKMP